MLRYPLECTYVEISERYQRYLSANGIRTNSLIYRSSTKGEGKRGKVKRIEKIEGKEEKGKNVGRRR